MSMSTSASVSGEMAVQIFAIAGWRILLFQFLHSKLTSASAPVTRASLSTTLEKRLPETRKVTSRARSSFSLWSPWKTSSTKPTISRTLEKSSRTYRIHLWSWTIRSSASKELHLSKENTTSKSKATSLCLTWKNKRISGHWKIVSECSFRLTQPRVEKL